MNTAFQLDDVPWIVAEAQRLWSNDPNPRDNRLWQLLAQSPQPQLELPQWARLDGDPFSEEYRDQVLRLWQALYDRGSATEGSEYVVAEHEQDAAYEDCPIRFPGYLARRDRDGVRHAGYEFAMLGDLLVQSGLSAGKRAIEYGAGSGNVAINLARLGVLVDTVDISKTYCEHIGLNADFYGVPLKAHNEEFGFDPSSGNHKYDCVIFHACFHHSLDHGSLVTRLAEILAPDGVVILSNEPITESFHSPWGLRTDPESISVIAGRGWMELGFRFTYLRELFFRNGLLLTEVGNSFSRIPLFSARKIAGAVPLALGSPYVELLEGIYAPELSGVWTQAQAKLPLPPANGFTKIAIDLSNHLPVVKKVRYTLGDASTVMELEPNSTSQIEIDVPAHEEATFVLIDADLHRPSEHLPANADARQLGVMLHTLTFR